MPLSVNMPSSRLVRQLSTPDWTSWSGSCLDAETRRCSDETDWPVWGCSSAHRVSGLIENNNDRKTHVKCQWNVWKQTNKQTNKLALTYRWKQAATGPVAAACYQSGSQQRHLASRLTRVSTFHRPSRHCVSPCRVIGHSFEWKISCFFILYFFIATRSIFVGPLEPSELVKWKGVRSSV